jgi:hypothetical protein
LTDDAIPDRRRNFESGRQQVQPRPPAALQKQFSGVIGGAYGNGQGVASGKCHRFRMTIARGRKQYCAMFRSIFDLF